jgi:aminomethyltransferase
MRESGSQPCWRTILDTATKTTALHALHQELGGKMVVFAGYELPVQYPVGIMTEHIHTRTKAGLFDVSHMGQVRISGADADMALETLVPGNIVDLKPGRIRYTFFTNAQGGILDDLTVGRADDQLAMVVNAACKDADLAHMQAQIGGDCQIEMLDDRALLAVQGPMAVEVLTRHAPACGDLGFMGFSPMDVGGIPCIVSRAGYTGEDGFEISVANDQSVDLARLLLAEDEVEPIGLGARDSLRLEAGLCLYGHDLDDTTTPIEGGLAWAIGKRRRENGGFPGDAIILGQMSNGTDRRRVGLAMTGRVPAREGTDIVDGDGTSIGTVTSGGFGPTLGAPVVMGYVASAFDEPGTKVGLVVRGTTHDAEIVPMPFVPHRYFRAKS